MRPKDEAVCRSLSSSVGPQWVLSHKMSRIVARLRHKEESKMLWTLVVILLVLWLLGLVTSYTLGGVIHVLLVIAVVVLVVNLIQGRRTL